MTFEQAQDAVKIGHFTRKGGVIRGVVHVGANDGEEIEGYLGLGAQSVLCFEPFDLACDELRRRWGQDERVILLPFALGDKFGWHQLNITAGDGKGSSYLRELDSPYETVGTQGSFVYSFDRLGIDPAVIPCNTLVVDVQGMELQVLRGFGTYLPPFDFLNIECSRVPQYEGEAPASEVIEFLSKQGFQQDSPIETHNDIFFVNRRLNWPMLF